MGKKIFVSYKYSDPNVMELGDYKENTTARSYVDKLEDILDDLEHIYKGEDDGEDMSTLRDAAIASKLGDKIYDSTVTIVLVSKGMKEDDSPEIDHWIPWEISYSLKEQTRDGIKSKTNAVLALVIPDKNNSYDYYITDNLACNSRTLNTNFLFQILRDNMFNRNNKEDSVRHCNGNKIYEGSPSYIPSVKWKDFVNNPNYYINLALQNCGNRADFNVTKMIS
jgi:hypothetical protein